MLVNGNTQDYLPLSDRALHYGDGVFETIRVRAGKAQLLVHHLRRLTDSCARLNIPCQVELLEEEIVEVLRSHQDNGVLKIIVSRGSGGRGYTPLETPSATRILQFHPLPANYADSAAISGVRAMVCKHPISTNSALAGIKHLNRIDQVMASIELVEGIDEGLMCNESGLLVEGIKSNVFLIFGDEVVTPDLTSSGVAGIMRAVLLDLCKAMNMKMSVRQIPLTSVQSATEVFLCNSVFGIWPVNSIVCGTEEWRFHTGNTTRIIQAQLKNVF